MSVQMGGGGVGKGLGREAHQCFPENMFLFIHNEAGLSGRSGSSSADNLLQGKCSPAITAHIHTKMSKNEKQRKMEICQSTEYKL